MSISGSLKRLFVRAARPEKGASDESEIVYIKNYYDRLEAEMAKSYLDSQGIHSIISAEDAGGSRPILGGVTGGARLLVLGTDAERATLLLDAITDDFPRDGRAG